MLADMKMRKLSILISIFLLLNYCGNRTSLFPVGFDIASIQDYYPETIKYNKGVVPSRIESDFNGNNIIDHAWILINRDKLKYGLFVQLDNDKKLITLDEVTMQSKYEYVSMGISIVKPGKYITANGKGYGIYDPAIADSVILGNNSINYYQFECSNSFYYWDNDIHGFSRVWISD